MNKINNDFDEEGNFILHIIERTWHLVKLMANHTTEILKDLIDNDLFDDKDKDTFRNKMMED